jgi:predicted RNase H-like HicB family nuclease
MDREPMTPEQQAAIKRARAHFSTPEYRAEASKVRELVEQEFPPAATAPEIVEAMARFRLLDRCRSFGRYSNSGVAMKTSRNEKFPMPSTLSVPLQIDIHVVVHEIDGGGFWAEVPRFPGCVTQVANREEIPSAILQAIDDWMSESPEKTEMEARQLAAIQGSNELPDDSYPKPYEYLPSPSWTDEAE